jgi:hypothetical protein
VKGCSGKCEEKKKKDPICFLAVILVITETILHKVLCYLTIGEFKLPLESNYEETVGNK